jgi:hypothetical protein
MAIKDKKKLARVLTASRKSPLEESAAVRSVLGSPDKSSKKKSHKGAAVIRKTPQQKLLDQAKRSKSHRKKVEKDRQRIRLLVDVPEEVRKAVIAIAEPKRISWSSVTSLLIALGLREVQQGHAEMEKFLRPSNTPRFDYEVDVESWLESVKGKGKA